MAIPAITALIRLGIPTAKIIKKYGKKAFDAAKKDLSKADKEDVKLLKQGAAAVASIYPIEKLKKLRIKKDD